MISYTTIPDIPAQLAACLSQPVDFSFLAAWGLQALDCPDMLFVTESAITPEPQCAGYATMNLTVTVTRCAPKSNSVAAATSAIVNQDMSDLLHCIQQLDNSVLNVSGVWINSQGGVVGVRVSFTVEICGVS